MCGFQHFNMKKQYKTIIFITVIILVFIGGYFLKDFLDKQNRAKEVNDYKKGFYDGLVCQYGCPMSLQNVSNKTQMLPDVDCVKGCSAGFKNKFSSFSVKKEELQKDKLLDDIDNLVKECKKNTINTTAYTFNNTAYFDCAVKSLSGLKMNYSYLG